MARQEQIFAETIVAMKKATARRDDASDSDDSITRPTNRGYKLKRKAKLAEPGRLDTTDGPRSFKRRILYNGFTRSILSQNPPRVDADGDVIDEAEDESDVDLTPAEDDPFAEIALHNLLMPLTAAVDLKQHPSMSVPYTSKAIDEMIQNAQDMLHREQEALWRMKQVASEFRGDHTWMPCEAFQTDNDAFYVTQIPSTASEPASMEQEIESAQLSSAANWDTMSNVRLIADLEEASMDGGSLNAPHDAYEAPVIPKESEQASNGEKTVEHSDLSEDHGELKNEDPTTSNGQTAIDGAMADAGTTDEDPQPTTAAYDENSNGLEPATTLAADEAAVAEVGIAAAVVSETTNPSTEPLHSDDLKPPPATENQPLEPTDTKMDDASAEDDISNPTSPPHRMTTRTRAQTTTFHPSPSPPLTSPSPTIHPLFLLPPSTYPSPNLGLPPSQADETRRLLCSYVQRQEEVCRGVDELYTGLLRARRMRDSVLEWCTAEGHVGEMSDGEDWVDLEEWGLGEGELRKGEEVEEEEEGVKGGKKTRNRRQVA